MNQTERQRLFEEIKERSGLNDQTFSEDYKRRYAERYGWRHRGFQSLDCFCVHQQSGELLHDAIMIMEKYILKLKAANNDAWQDFEQVQKICTHAINQLNELAFIHEANSALKLQLQSLQLINELQSEYLFSIKVKQYNERKENDR